MGISCDHNQHKKVQTLVRMSLTFLWPFQRVTVQQLFYFLKKKRLVVHMMEGTLNFCCAVIIVVSKFSE